MIQPGERLARGVVLESPSAYARSRLALLWNDVRVGSPELARLGLVALSLTFFTMVIFTPGHFRPTGIPYYAFQVVFGTLAGLIAAFLATLPVRTIFGLRARRVLGAYVLTAVVVLPVVGFITGSPGAWRMLHGAPYGNDGAMMDQYAALQVLRGHNPYLKTNVVKALASINAPCTTTTPLMDGQFRGARVYPSESAVDTACLAVLKLRPGTIPAEFESKYNYPAGAFLQILPFVWLGFRDIRFLYALAILAMGIYLWFRVARTLRPLVPVLMLANAPMLLNINGGQPDPIYALWLMLGYAEWRRGRVSPIAMGIATATKQLAWFYVPFYLIVVIRNLGWREGLRRVGIMAAIFAVTNGPFIVQSPGAYIASIGAPMADPMFPLGMGLIALFSSNVLPMLPKLFFTCFELGAWILALFGFLRLRWLSPASGVVLSTVPLFFAWRSLDNYFYLVPFIALAVVLAEQGARADTVAITPDRHPAQIVA